MGRKKPVHAQDTATKETAAPDNETGYGTLENPDTFALSGYCKTQFESGRKYGNLNQARAEVADLFGVPERTKLRLVRRQVRGNLSCRLLQGMFSSLGKTEALQVRRFFVKISCGIRVREGECGL